VSMFPPAARRVQEVFIDLLGLAFGLLLLWYGGGVAYQSWSYGDVSTTSLRFPLWIYVSALPAGGLSLAVGYAIRLARLWKARTR
jgi:C4-dicarboxylate transporter, DctQ subunit